VFHTGVQQFAPGGEPRGPRPDHRNLNALHSNSTPR
jgi:hypothetical protein